jgi:hypothetical protein
MSNYENLITNNTWDVLLKPLLHDNIDLIFLPLPVTISNICKLFFFIF